MWFWYAGLSALASAVSVLLNKKSLVRVNPSLVSWSMFAFSLPFLAYPAFKDGLPELNAVFWICTFASMAIFGFAKTLALKSLKGGLMSEIVPLAFFSVLFQYVFGLVFFSEKLKTLPAIGLALIISGGYLLKVGEARENYLKPFKVLFTEKNALMYLAAMVLMTASSVFDKYALLNITPINQAFYLFAGNLIVTVLIAGYMQRKYAKWLYDLKSEFLTLFLSALAYTAVSLAYLYAITTGALALVSGVKKLEVFFVLALGWLLFKDKPRGSVWAGSLIMLVGVLMTRLG